MLNIAIIMGSTRPNRNNEAVSNWVFDIAKQRGDANFELVDIKDYDLPLLDEPESPAQGNYTQPHTKHWSEKIDQFDGFVFVNPEYNNSVSGALKNAIDFLYREWNNKSAGIVGYGSNGAMGSGNALRQIFAELQIADVRQQVSLTFREDFENYTNFKPGEGRADQVNGVIDQVLLWGEAMKSIREKLANQ